MQRSEQLFATAQNLIPGGVNSPVRAFRGVGGTPRFIQSARGATITDVDGKTYIDYVGSWGPMILGHADEEVVAAVQQVAARGTSFGARAAISNARRPPKEWPTRTAGSVPTVRAIACTCASIVHGGSYGEDPWPTRSGASTR